MSQFDDDEDYIINGSHSSQEERRLLRLFASEAKTVDRDDCWTMGDGKVMKVVDASDRHLYNMREKLKREGRGARLRLAITIELDTRHAQGVTK